MNSQTAINTDFDNFDINWYFTDLHGHLICVASGGGSIPRIITESIPKNALTHSSILDSAPLFDVEHNPILHEYVDLSNVNSEDYYRTFDDVACRGFYAFDKIKLSDPMDGDYILVSYPKRRDYARDFRPSVIIHHLLLSLARTGHKCNYLKRLAQIPQLNLPIINKLKIEPLHGNSIFHPIEITSRVNNASVLFS